MATEVTVPQLGESIVEATVGKWMKRVGDAVASGEPLLELETDKVNVEVPAPTAGVLASIAHAEGETVAVGDLLATLTEGDSGSSAAVGVAAATAAPAANPSPVAAPLPAAAPPAAPAPPSVRRLATAKSVDLSAVAGTGPHGRITRDDVAAAARTATPTAVDVPPVARPPAPPSAASPASPASPASAGEGREERQRMSRRRLTIARQLVEAQQTAAMLTTFNEVDLTAVMRLRQQRRDAFRERHGVGLGFMSFFTKAVVSALKAYPRLNAEIQGDEMILKRYYDIGVAVSTPEGLVVPVVRDADRLTFAQIEAEIARLAERARTGALTLDDLRGGTFTITNGGVFGSLLSTPILNPPQVGILGMHGLKDRPVAVDGRVEIRPMMYLALTYDHRIVDGSESVRFLVHVKQMIEDPMELLLEG
jgi:2-oxoglutarate dehydrogenase E2 component (dihydrolipoamide succinyltransferase)